MKKIFTYHFDWSLTTIAFFSLIVSFFVFINIVQANFPGGGLDKNLMEMNGWAWSPNIGWLSLNCLNDFNGDGDLDDGVDNTCATVPYGLRVDQSEDATIMAVGGCAWAGNVGWWICFDEPNPSEPKTLAPTWGVYLNDYYWSGDLPDNYFTPMNPKPDAVLNSLFHDSVWSTEFSNGHASILSLENVAGWSNELGFPIMNSVMPTSLEGCFNCEETKTCRTDGAICTQDTDCGVNGPCDTARTCDNCLQYTYDPDDPDVLDSVTAGYQCSDCTLTSGLEVLCTENAYERNKNSCKCDNYFTTPGLMVDYTTISNDNYGSMCGWAWNQADSGNGVGWIQFGPRITAGNNPYFQVDSGDIYARGEIKNINILGPNIYNAFIIETNSNITPFNIWASSTLPTVWSKDRPLISFPTKNEVTGKYTNVLGSIDYAGLITEVGETGKNKYGSVINLYNGSDPKWQIIDSDAGPGGKILLDNTVYYDESALIIDGTDDLVIESGKNNENASGIFVFGDGPTLILKNIKYSSDNADVGKLKNVNSLVWIIKGDLFIDPSVTEIAGTFIVLGDGVACEVDEWNCGRFITSYDQPGSNQLKINGSVLARKFVLGRTYSSGPSELFINDGRLKVNPPAGLQNFSANLPKFGYQ